MKVLVNWLLVVVCFLIIAPGAAFSAPAASEKAPSAAVSMVAVNNAGVKQLRALPGIGAVTAQRIVDYRQAHGPFTRVEDLLKVKGVGKQTLEKIRGRISLN
jgi:competence protein ComEA